MSGIIITKELIADIEAIADYFGKSSNIVLQDLVGAELERVMPLIKAKQFLETSGKDSSPEKIFRVKTVNELEKSKPVEGEFAKVRIWERSWRAVTSQILQILCDKNYISRDKLTTLLPSIANINIAQGIREDSGYIPMPELKISVQGLSAPRVGEFIQKIAEYYKIPYAFKLRWNDSANMRERTGLFASADS